jgi:hypothetical protein
MIKQDLIQRLEDVVFTKLWGGTTREHFTVNIGPLRYCYVDLVNEKLKPLEDKLERLIDSEGYITLGNNKMRVEELCNKLEELL